MIILINPRTLFNYILYNTIFTCVYPMRNVIYFIFFVKYSFAEYDQIKFKQELKNLVKKPNRSKEVEHHNCKKYKPDCNTNLPNHLKEKSNFIVNLLFLYANKKCVIFLLYPAILCLLYTA